RLVGAPQGGDGAQFGIVDRSRREAEQAGGLFSAVAARVCRVQPVAQGEYLSLPLGEHGQQSDQLKALLVVLRLLLLRLEGGQEERGSRKCLGKGLAIGIAGHVQTHRLHPGKFRRPSGVVDIVPGGVGHVDGGIGGDGTRKGAAHHRADIAGERLGDGHGGALVDGSDEREAALLHQVIKGGEPRQALDIGIRGRGIVGGRVGHDHCHWY
ncbi:MAG TPA: hypothetical protein VEL31_24645, partial [Ktedonobacteraceae bacterium]|nr:hypothetical protein [Ktedonobacteraceae bacterium]